MPTRQDEPFSQLYRSETHRLASVDDIEVGKVGEEVAAYLKSEQGDSAAPSLPLNFASVQEEIGFIFLEEALRCGCMYDRLLTTQAPGRRASSETVQFGLLSMFISGKPPFKSDHLLELSDAHAVGGAFEFPTHESKALDFAQLGGVYQDVDGPLHPFALIISRQASEMGVLLRSRGMDHLGELALDIFKHADGNLNKFSSELAACLPNTFRDEAKGIKFHTKAQRVASVLMHRFPSHFPFSPESCANFTGFANAELCLALRNLGVVRLAPQVEQVIDSEQQILKYGNDIEVALRVACLEALARMTMLTRKDQASLFLLDKGKTVAHGNSRLHLCSTMYY